MIKEELAIVYFFPLRKHNLHYMRDPAVAAKEIRASKQACKKRSYKSARAFISSFFVRNKKCQPNRRRRRRRRRHLQRELQPDAAGSISSSGGEPRRDGPVGGGKTQVVSFFPTAAAAAAACLVSSRAFGRWAHRPHLYMSRTFQQEKGRLLREATFPSLLLRKGMERTFTFGALVKRRT